MQAPRRSLVGLQLQLSLLLWSAAAGLLMLQQQRSPRLLLLTLLECLRQAWRVEASRTWRGGSSAALLMLVDGQSNSTS